MTQKPAYYYYCDCCGKRFESKWECEEHEEKCKYEKEVRETRRRNCRRCGGTGYITESYQDQVWYEPRNIWCGEGYYKTVTRYHEVPCPYCNSYS